MFFLSNRVLVSSWTPSSCAASAPCCTTRWPRRRLCACASLRAAARRRTTPTTGTSTTGGGPRGRASTDLGESSGGPYKRRRPRKKVALPLKVIINLEWQKKHYIKTVKKRQYYLSVPACSSDTYGQEKKRLSFMRFFLSGTRTLHSERKSSNILSADKLPLSYFGNCARAKNKIIKSVIIILYNYKKRTFQVFITRRVEFDRVIDSITSV